jgi:phosphopantothenoylcysteine decarboxylase/phosphopantothenate--cysteine ligase
MHPAMWSNPATTSNISVLRDRGFHIMEPATGALTSGDVGKGRLPDTNEIIDEINSILAFSSDLKGKKIIVTAGGTREPIDPVRYIGNRSSGKQGYALARAAARRGAEVTLISANVSLDDLDGVETIRVETATELQSALELKFVDSDILIMCAAIADARPSEPQDSKIRKSDYQKIELVENVDILSALSGMKKKQLVIAFAAETSHDRDSALKKLKDKGADILYLNDVSAGDIFNTEITHGEIFMKDGTSTKVAKTTKDTLANELLNKALSQLG